MKKILLLILGCFLLSLFIETVFFNFSYFRYGKVNETVNAFKFENIEQLDNSMYRIIDDKKPAKLSIPVKNSKATRLSFVSNSLNSSEAKVSISSEKNQYGERKMQDSLEVVKLVGHPKEIILSFSNIQDQEFSIADVKLSNPFYFNLLRFVVVFSILTLAILVILGVFKNRYEYFGLIVVLLFGTILAIVMPAGQTMDERAHILKSFSVAEGKWMFENGDKLKLPAGIEMLYLEEPFTSYEEFKDIYNKSATAKMRSLKNEEIHTSAATYPFIPYLFSGLGIKVAMVLHLPVMVSIWLARMFNVLAYALLVFFSIKKMPYGKRWMTFFAVQPVMLYLAASIGVDAILVGAIMLGFSQIMRIRFEKSIVTKKEFVLIASCFTLAILTKVVYAPALVLFFLLKKENFKTKKAQWVSYVSMSLILFIVSIVVYKYSSDMGINQWGLEGVNPDLQLTNIFRNPLSYLKMLTVFFSTTSINYLQSTFGLMGYVLSINSLVTVINIFIMLFLCTFDGQLVQEESKSYFNWVEKLMILFSIFSMFILSATALYITFTPVGSLTVDGYQARYLTPMFFLSMSIISTSKIKSSYSEKFLDNVTFLGIISILAFVFITVIGNYFA